MKAPFWSLFMCAVVMQPLPVLFQFVFADAGVCSDSPCRNGGTCIPGVGTYTCQCMFGYLGDHCEQGLWLSSSNLSLSLSRSLSLSVSVCLSISLSLCLSVCLCLSVSLSVSLSLCLSLSLSLSLLVKSHRANRAVFLELYVNCTLKILKSQFRSLFLTAVKWLCLMLHHFS